MAVIERFAKAFWQRYGRSVTVDQRSALQAILQCRTSALGGHRYGCACGHSHYAWHSCNHRLCPQCGGAGTADWVDKQLGKLLPVPYFMVTFTLPDALRPVLRQRAGMEAFFQCSAQALTELLADPKRTGFTRSGFFGIYQSWRQDMGYHPHIHYIVPGVGLDAEDRAVHLKNPKFLLYAQALANRLRTLLANRLLEENLIERPHFRALVKRPWNASVDPAGSGENAVKYLGKYVQKSVIGDNRILGIEGEHVRIRIRNRDTQQNGTRLLEGVEFIRRFLLHALPSGFHRIRYRGYLHARAKRSLQWLQVQLDARLRKREQPTPAGPPLTCPRCGSPLHRTGKMARAPPMHRNHHFHQIVAA